MSLPHSFALSRRLALAGTTASVLTLAACGGGGSSSAPGTPIPAQPTTPEPAPNPVPAPAPAPVPGPTAPVISVQPASVTVASGAPATFSVSAAGDATLQYQWLRNGVPVPQAVQPRLTVTAAPADDGAIYRAVVKSAGGEVRSEAAALRLTGAAQYKVIGAVDEAYLLAQSWPTYYAGVAIGPSGELLVDANDGGASLLRQSGSSLAPVGRFAGCVAEGGVVADRLGNAYLACARAVIRIASNGAATVVAGSVADGAVGNLDGKGGAARFNTLSAIAIGSDGVLYVGDAGNRNVRRIDTDGTVSTLAGSPVSNLGEDGVGRAAGFRDVRGLAVDAQGNVYASDRFAIRRITSAGVVTTIAGSLAEAGARDGPALTARFNGPAGLVFDSAGRLLIADSANRSIRKLGPDGYVSTFVDSSALADPADSTGDQPDLSMLRTGLAIDANDQVYVVDGTRAIRRITPAGVVSTVHALPVRSASGGFRDGAASVARFNTTSGLSADIAGNLYVADLGNGAVRKVAPTGMVSTLARGITPVSYGYANSLMKVSAGVDGSVYALTSTGTVVIDASGAVTQLGIPAYPGGYRTYAVDIAADRKGNRYELIEESVPVSCGGLNGCPDELRRSLHRVGADGAIRDWHSGDVPARTAVAPYWWPMAISTDAAGNLYLSELMTNAIWKLTPAGEWSLFGGTRQSAAAGLAVDSQGNVYALDNALGLLSVRRITPDGKVTVLTDNPSTPRLFAIAGSRSTAIAIDADDRLWVTQGDGIVQVVHP